VSIKEHAIITACVLAIVMAFNQLLGTEALPEVIDYDMEMSEWEVQGICEEYVEQQQKPCTVVKIDDRICYAYQELDGTSHPVHCFKAAIGEEDE